MYIDIERELYQLFLLHSLKIDEYDLINSASYITHTNLQQHIIIPSHILYKENNNAINKKLTEIIKKVKDFNSNDINDTIVKVYKINNKNISYFYTMSNNSDTVNFYTLQLNELR